MIENFVKLEEDETAEGHLQDVIQKARKEEDLYKQTSLQTQIRA